MFKNEDKCVMMICMHFFIHLSITQDTSYITVDVIVVIEVNKKVQES